MKWRFVAPVLLVLAFACVAKVEKPAQQPEQRSRVLTPANDPCAWLSEHDATEALGQSVVRTQSAAPTYCKYSASAAGADGTALSIQFSVDDDTASYDKFVQRDDAASLAGLGDRAVWNTSGNSVIVVKGARRLILSITDAKTPSAFSEGELQQKAVGAAQKIVEKM